MSCVRFHLLWKKISPQTETILSILALNMVY